jgi:metallo-beta-lactamase class B
MRTFIFLILLIFSLTKLLGQSAKPALRIAHLTGDFYIYTTYEKYQGSLIPGNGMYLLTGDGAVLFDTPWDTTQFQPLLDSIKLKHNKHVISVFATHWHSDKTAGLEYYRKQGIKTYTTALTDELSKKNGKKRAAYLMTKDTLFTIGQYSFETYFPGEAHTLDNIVIWFEREKILYAGCLIKGVDDKTLGFTDDGNTQTYAATLEKVKRKFKKPAHIIIAHSDWNNLKSLDHSIIMAKALKKNSHKAK